jgi:hypothetical protein
MVDKIFKVRRIEQSKRDEEKMRRLSIRDMKKQKLKEKRIMVRPLEGEFFFSNAFNHFFRFD